MDVDFWAGFVPFRCLPRHPETLRVGKAPVVVSPRTSKRTSRHGAESRARELVQCGRFVIACAPPPTSSSFDGREDREECIPIEDFGKQ